MVEDDINQNTARPELLQIAESVAREKSIDQVRRKFLIA